MVQPIANSYAERAETAPLLRRVVRNMAVVDWIASVYFLIMATALVATRHANWAGSLKDICIDWAVLVVMLVLVRGELVRGAAASTLFRVGIASPIVLSYFQLRWILPAINPGALDRELYAFDMRVFHYEPSVAWDQFVNPQLTEWFAFFYFGYFIIVASFVLPFLGLSGDNKLLRHFGTGIVAQF